MRYHGTNCNSRSRVGPGDFRWLLFSKKGGRAGTGRFRKKIHEIYILYIRVSSIFFSFLRYYVVEGADDTNSAILTNCHILSGSYLSLLCLQNTQTVQNVWHFQKFCLQRTCLGLITMCDFGSFGVRPSLLFGDKFCSGTAVGGLYYSLILLDTYMYSRSPLSRHYYHFDNTIVTYLCSWKMLRRVQFWKEVVL